MSGAEARLAAAQLLVETLDRGRTLDDALGQVKAFKDLSGPDRGFARAIASAALRQLGRLDQGLAPFLDRPIEASPPEARALIRAGAAQLWLLSSAPHAAVGETVAAAKVWPEARRAAGFVNAVLRKAAEDEAGFSGQAAEAVWPVWLRSALRISLGAERAGALAAAQIEESPLHLTAKQDPETVVRMVEGELLASGSIVAPFSAVTSLPGYDEGAWWVQDQAAALPARLFSSLEGETVYDLCAAPGGKTMQLAAVGAQVVALDRSKPRLTTLRKNIERTQLADRVRVQQGTVENWTPPEPARRILVDAPCSALGTLRRHPEGAWIKSPADVARFPEIQTRILAHACDQLAPGGELIYCVCTPLEAEGVAVVEKELERQTVKRAPVRPEEALGFEDCITEAGDVLTLPSAERDCDAFFISRLTKSSF